MANTSLHKAIRNMLIIALVFSVLFVAGIPMIPVGFYYGIYPVGILGIIFTVAGFYGTPFVWIAFAALVSHKGVYSMIEDDGVYSVNSIANTLGMNVKKTRGMVTYLINKRYLKGYTFDGADTIVPTSALGAAGKANLSLGKCPNCGAILTELGNTLRCPYCGGVFPRGK